MKQIVDGVQVDEGQVNYLRVYSTWVGDRKVFVSGGLDPETADFFIGLTPEQAILVGNKLIEAAEVAK